jgi:hypothetical protein
VQTANVPDCCMIAAVDELSTRSGISFLHKLRT